MILYITVGIPGAGKTTMSRKIEAETGAVRVSYDEERFKVRHRFRTPTGKLSHEERERIVFEKAQAALSEGKDAIYDCLNITKAARANILGACQIEGVKKIAVWMNASPETILYRRGYCSQRLLDKLEPPTEEEGFDEVWIFDEGGRTNANTGT